MREPCDLHRTYNSGCPACKLKAHGIAVPGAKVAEVLAVPATEGQNDVPVEDIAAPEPVADIPLPEKEVKQTTEESEPVRVDDFDGDDDPALNELI